MIGHRKENNMRKKTLMVVYDKGYKDYATILNGLVSAKDDKKDEGKTVIVGTEDDTFEMGMMTNKQYIDNKQQFSSDQKILFIGDTDASGLLNVMKVSYKKHGVLIGSLGNMMLVTTNVKALYALTGSPYADFINEFEQKYDLPIAKQKRKLDWNKETTIKALIDYFFFRAPALLGATAAADIILSQCQQRTFAIYELYMNHLDKFMKA